MKKAYSVVIVGAGNIGALFENEPKRPKPASHAGAVLAHPKARLVAFVDTDSGNLAKASKLFPHVTQYTSLEYCLTEVQPTVVIIATPPQSHRKIIALCAKRGIPVVVCEKPLATTLAEAKAIQRIVDRYHLSFVLNYQRRFSPLYAQVRNLIASGKLGSIQQVTCYYSNGLYNNGGHLLDALNYVLGDDIQSVMAVVHKRNMTHPARDLNVDAILTTAKGTSITLQSFDQHAYAIHDMRIFGTKGSLTLGTYGMELVYTKTTASPFAGLAMLSNKPSKVIKAPMSATKDALAEAIACYEKGTRPRSSAANGVDVMQVLDAIAESAKKNGKRITIR